MTLTQLLTRIRTVLAAAMFFPPAPATAEQASDALQEVTRWAWLPPLSGVAVAADHTFPAHGNADGKAREQAEKTH